MFRMRQFTVTVKEHCCEEFGPAAVQVTVVTPGGKREPEGGLQERVYVGSQTVGWNVTTRPELEVQLARMFAGHCSPEAPF